ncbi:MAG: tRNA (N(6)-L-threonylcarbamoyladenosine(37)-C(2))-methylthiotransferase MtaB [Atribacterota bacterium]
MRIAIKTLGCKVNQAESEALILALVQNGFEVVDFSQESDLYIVNGCAVTQEAERKTRQMVHQALRRNAQALVLLVGCTARLFWRENEDPWDGRVVILPAQDKEKAVLEYVSRLIPPLPRLHREFPSSRVRSWVKVEDGCDHFCSYCIVPHLRGGIRSVAPQRILDEVQRLEAKGVREVVLCGINLGYFGRDIAFPFIDLLELLVRETKGIRFRLSSLEPFLLTGEFLERYVSLGKRVCPHFHLPLQSGSDRILQRMGRGYDTAFYRSLVDTLRQMVSSVAITTDVMVGFPGETEDDFQKTVHFCRTVGFARMHVFSFSPRPGTLAFQWEREMGVKQGDKKRREKVLLELAEESRAQYHRQFLGKTVEVVIESVRSGVAFGYSEQYIPVRIPGVMEKKIGEVLRVRIKEVESNWVVAESPFHQEELSAMGCV